MAAWWRLFLPALGIQAILRAFDSCSYSKFVWVFMAYARLQAWLGRPALMPVACCSAYAMAATWYGGSLLLDRSIPARIKDTFYPMCGWTRFVVMDGVVHGLPLVSALQYHVWQHGRLPASEASSPLVAHSGLYSLLLHLAWAMLASGGFDMDALYVPCSPRVWNRMWTISLAAHALGLFMFE